MQLKYTKDYGVRQGKKNGVTLAYLFLYILMIWKEETSSERERQRYILHLTNWKKLFILRIEMWSDHFLTVR